MKTSNRIRVLLAGSVSEVTRALTDLLLRQSDIHVVGESPEILKIPEHAWKRAPHVILLYVRGAQFALEVVHEVLVKLPGARLLLVIPSCNDAQAVQIIEHGARGILPAEQEYEQGVRAIRAVSAGEIWGSRTVLSLIAKSSIQHTMDTYSHSRSMLTLTGREREVVNLLRDGSSNKTIASRLSISDKTVKTHLQNIFSKLHIRRRQMIFTSSQAQAPDGRQ